jgi:hypothetical protein
MYNPCNWSSNCITIMGKVTPVAGKWCSWWVTEAELQAFTELDQSFNGDFIETTDTKLWNSF